MRYEDLISEPRKTLARLGEFLDHDLDYDRIQKCGSGQARVNPTRHFWRKLREVKTNPMNRWKQRLSREEVAALESLVGDCLEELGYALTTPRRKRRPGCATAGCELCIHISRYQVVAETPDSRRTDGQPLRTGVGRSTDQRRPMQAELGAAKHMGQSTIPQPPQQAPVFVLGCGRSGTKFLYHTLLSAGGSPSTTPKATLSIFWACASAICSTAAIARSY